jgi:hypothetical protein
MTGMVGTREYLNTNTIQKQKTERIANLDPGSRFFQTGSRIKGQKETGSRIRIRSTELTKNLSILFQCCESGCGSGRIRIILPDPEDMLDLLYARESLVVKLTKEEDGLAATIIFLSPGTGASIQYEP